MSSLTSSRIHRDDNEVKRREPLNLAHVLEDRRPSTIPVPIIEKRIHTRFDKAFLVQIGSELYGDTFEIGRAHV